ncbi:MAG TPA: FUSC family protein [Streptosporangiaceae bacterium]|nr:FUSC family protein [Streptosporangiaceae bacterium]
MAGETPVAGWLRAGRRIVSAELRRGGWLRFGQFRWQDMDLFAAVRAGVGMITPLAAGIAAGHAGYGVFAALGSLPAGFASFQGVSRTRVTTIVLATAGMAAATFAGGTAAYVNGWLLVPAVVAVSYLIGLFVALGPRFSVAGLQWVIQLVIASDIPLPPREAALRAAFVLAGGLWQGILVVASWAVVRGGQERSALAATYRALGQYAATLSGEASGTDGRPGPPQAVAFPGTEVLRDPNPLLGVPVRLRMLLLLEQAERIRATLAALATFTPQSGLLTESAQILSGLAGAIEARRGHGQRAAALAERIEAVSVPGDAAWAWAGEALLGQLRAAARILGRLDDTAAEPSAEPATAGGRRHRPWRTAAATLSPLRGSTGLSSEAGRHALRLAVIAGAGEVIAVGTGLPHGYWVVLTIAIVLKPDYASTVYRGVQRAAGTVIGAGLGVATALLLHVSAAALVAGIGVTMTIAYAVFAVNYLLYAVFLTDFVVALLALLGEPADTTAIARLAGTVIGGTLALAGYFTWPTWAGDPAQRRIARLFETQARYAAALLRACADPRAADPKCLRSAQQTARTARFDAEAATDRLADEPARPPVTAALAYALTGAMRRFAHAALILHAAIESERAGGDVDAAALDRFASGLVAAAEAIARSLQTQAPPRRLPPLRQMQRELNAAAAPGTRTPPGIRAGPGNGWADDAGDGPREGSATIGDVLLTATDEFTDALDTAADVLRRHLGGPGAPAR